MARPPFSPSDDQRKLVEQLAAFGIPHEQMLHFVHDKSGKEIALNTLKKHFRNELDTGRVKANVKIAQSLFKKAMTGDTTSMIFWLKTQAGWKEPLQVEHSGPGGGPIKQETTVVDAQAVKAIVDKLEGEY